MKHLLTLLCFFSLLTIKAQEKKTETKEERQQRYIDEVNPFRQFGYTPKIGTLSNGKYREAYPDTIVQIGSFSYNKLLKQVVGVIENDESQDSEATLKPHLASRWFSPDPLSSEFPEWSPYNFVNNDPIRFIDPTGLAPEDIIFKNNNDEELGRIVLPGPDVEVQIDTDYNMPTPFVIEPKFEDNLAAVGFNIEFSGTVGGGIHTGSGAVYFLKGENKGELYTYDFSGGNIGLGGGAGIGTYGSIFNKGEANRNLFSVNGFEGKYNGYSASLGVEASYTWSNEKNTSDELWPSMRHPWTWKSTSLGGGVGTQADIRFTGGKTSNFKQIDID